MFLLGSNAVAAPASLDEDDPNFIFTSSAAMKQPILVAKPTCLKCNAQRDSTILTPVLHPQFSALLHSMDNQPLEEHHHRGFIVFGLGLKDSGYASTALL